MIRNRLFVLVAVLISTISSASTRNFDVVSPDGTLKASIVVGDEITYSITKNGDDILVPSEISMKFSDGTSFDAYGYRKASRQSVDNMLTPPFYRKSHIRENYNELVLTFKTFRLLFRAYDSGVAYRFQSLKKGEYQVVEEISEFAFPADWNAWIPYVNPNKKGRSQFFNSFENTYQYATLSSWERGRYAFLPLMVETPDGYKVNIMESDLLNYPGMYLSNADVDSSLEAVFAPYPKTVEQGGHNMLQAIVTETEDYIAKCNGPTSFPWRIVSVSSHDKEMLDNDLVWLLGTPADSASDWSWVKPGKVAWEWWNDWNITGVDFKAGVNNDTYKYYIDFASRNGIEYIILDEGWL